MACFRRPLNVTSDFETAYPVPAHPPPALAKIPRPKLAAAWRWQPLGAWLPLVQQLDGNQGGGCHQTAPAPPVKFDSSMQLFASTPSSGPRNRIPDCGFGSSQCARSFGVKRGMWCPPMGYPALSTSCLTVPAASGAAQIAPPACRNLYEPSHTCWVSTSCRTARWASHMHGSSSAWPGGAQLLPQPSTTTAAPAPSRMPAPAWDC